MKKFKLIAILFALIIVVTGCGNKKADLSKYAGTYKGLFIKMVSVAEIDRESDFSLTLNKDGTGTHHRNNMNFKVTYTVDGDKFTMKETFIGDPIIYEGTIEDGIIDIYNGKEDDPYTYEYRYELEK